MVALKKVVRQLVPRGELLRAWPLEGGISATMTALEIAAPDGERRKVVVRHYGRADQRSQTIADEYRFLQVARSLQLPVPAPCFLDESGEILPASYMVIEYVEGEMVFAPVDRRRHAERLAERLAEIHRADCTACDLSFLAKGDCACPELDRESPPPAGVPFDPPRIRDVLASVGPRKPRNTPALLHGDFWPGNTLWRDGELVAVVDWEDAGLGDPLIDLAQTRSEVAWIFGIDALEAFTGHYQSAMDLDYADLPYWDLCATLRFMRFVQGDLGEMAAFFEPYGRADITEQTIRRDYRSFIEQALAALAA